MRALPATPYVFAEWKERTVAFDYHVDVDRHYYSVPHALVGHACGRASRRAASSVLQKRARRDPRALYQRGAHTQIPEHMPKAHRAHAEWSPKRLIQWVCRSASTPAPSLSICCARAPSGARLSSMSGALMLARQYGDARLERRVLSRCASAAHAQEREVDPRERPDLRGSSPTEPLALELPAHGNVRGPGYYH